MLTTSSLTDVRADGPDWYLIPADWRHRDLDPTATCSDRLEFRGHVPGGSVEYRCPGCRAWLLFDRTLSLIDSD